MVWQYPCVVLATYCYGLPWNNKFSFETLLVSRTTVKYFNNIHNCYNFIFHFVGYYPTKFFTNMVFFSFSHPDKNELSAALSEKRRGYLADSALACSFTIIIIFWSPGCVRKLFFQWHRFVITFCIVMVFYSGRERPCQLMRHYMPVWSDGSQQWCKVDVVVLGWCCSAHTGMKWALAWAVWQNGHEWVLCLRKLYVLTGIDCGLLVVSQQLIDNGGPYCTGWYCFGRNLVPPFQPCFRSIENIK